MTTVREVIDAAKLVSKNGKFVITKRFLGNETYHTFTDPYEGEQFIKNDIYNNIQMHMAPNVEMPIDVCGVFKFKVVPTLNSYTGDSVGGTLDYVNDREDSKR